MMMFSSKRENMKRSAVVLLFFIALCCSCVDATTSDSASSGAQRIGGGGIERQGQPDNLSLCPPNRPSVLGCEEAANSVLVLEEFHSSQALSSSSEAVKESLRSIIQFVAINCPAHNHDVDDYELQAFQQRHQENRNGEGKMAVVGNNITTTISGNEYLPAKFVNPRMIEGEDEEHYSPPRPNNMMFISNDVAQDQRRERTRREETIPRNTILCDLNDVGMNCRNSGAPSTVKITLVTSSVQNIVSALKSDTATDLLRRHAPTVALLTVEFTVPFPNPTTPIPNELWTVANWGNVRNLIIYGENGGVEFGEDNTFASNLFLTINIVNPHFSDSSFVHLQTALVGLSIQDATSLTSLPAGVFRGLRNLQFLTIPSAPSLATIHPNTFRGLSGLRRLTLRNTAISSLASDQMFSDLSILQELNFANNRITSLPSGIFASLTSLNVLDFSGNLLDSLPQDLFQSLTALTTLRLNNNMLTTLPAKVFPSMTGRLRLYLQNNQLQIDEETSEELWPSLTQLSQLFIGGNIQLQLNADHLRFNSNFFTLDANNIKLFIPPNANNSDSDGRGLFRSINRLDLDGTPLSIDHQQELIAFFDDLRNLNHFAIGYETGFFELSQQVFGDVDSGDFLCKNEFLKSGTVNYLKISHSSFTTITLCTDRVDFLDLSDNPDLQRVVLNEAGTMRVRNSINLNEISATKVEFLDVSNTNFPYSNQLCQTLGTDLMYARNMRHPSFQQPSPQMEQLLRDCVENVNVVDVSNTPAFRDPSFMTNVLSQPISLASCSSNSDNCRPVGERELIPGRTTVPTLIADGHHYECTLEIREMEFEAGIGSQFSFQCDCANEFGNRDGQCINDHFTQAQVAALAASVSVGFCVLIAAVTAWFQRRIKHKQRQHEESDLEKSLLLEYQAQDLEVLKQAWEIDVGELRKIKKLDEGAFGEVWTCEWGTITVAVKYLKYTSQELGDLAQDYINDFRKEADFLQRTRNPHVVRFFGTGTDQWGSPFIVLEYISLGSLRRLLDKGLVNVIREYHNNELKSRHTSTTSSFAIENATMTSSAVDDDAFEEDNIDVTSFESQQDVDGFDAVLVDVIKTPRQLRHKLIRDVALGMDFLHKHGILHRDLKAGNVLVSKRLQAKLTDFGSISRHLRGVHEEQQHDMTKLKKLKYSKSAGMMSLSATSEDAVGTPLYMAPEVLLGRKAQKHSEKSDVFSYGVLLWEVATEQRPDLVEQEVPGYRGPLLLQLNTLLNQGRRLQFPDTLQSDPATSIDGWYKKLYGECVSLDSNERPSFHDILACDGWGRL